jgi:hypothetical protein
VDHHRVLTWLALRRYLSGRLPMSTVSGNAGQTAIVRSNLETVMDCNVHLRTESSNLALREVTDSVPVGRPTRRLAGGRRDAGLDEDPHRLLLRRTSSSVAG